MISEHSLWIDKMQDFAGALRQEAEAPEIARPQTVYLVDHDRLEREFLHRKADNELCGLGSDDERLKFETARRALRSFGVSDRETEQAYQNFQRQTQQSGSRGEISYEQFVAGFYNLGNNTNFITMFDRSFIFLDNKEKNMAASGKIMFSGVSPELREALNGVNIFEVSKKRGLYHEAVHCTGTDNEAYCDAFACLKIVQEHSNPAIADFLANARLNGMMYPLAVMSARLRSGDKEGADKWRSYIMNPALKQIKNRTRSLWRNGKLSALNDRELLAEALTISQTAQYSPETMQELDEALAAPLTFESLKNTTVIKDTFALAGIADEQAQKRFLEDGLIYNGMFRVLCDGGKDIEKEVLNHPQRWEQARRIMRKWGMDEERQREFLNRNRQTENNNDAEKKLLLLRGQKFINEEGDTLKKQYPGLSLRELQYQLTHRFIDYNLEQISAVGLRFRQNPRLYFDRAEAGKSSSLCRLYLQQATASAEIVNNCLTGHNHSIAGKHSVKEQESRLPLYEYTYPHMSKQSAAGKALADQLEK